MNSNVNVMNAANNPSSAPAQGFPMFSLEPSPRSAPAKPQSSGSNAQGTAIKAIHELRNQLSLAMDDMFATTTQSAWKGESKAESIERVIEEVGIAGQDRPRHIRGVATSPEKSAPKGLSTEDRRKLYFEAAQRRMRTEQRARLREAIAGGPVVPATEVPPLIVSIAPSAEDSSPQATEDQAGFANGAYIDFAIAMMVSAASDIAEADKELALHEIHGHLTRDRLGKLQFMRDSAEAWLDGYQDCAFTYRDCIQLFNEELRMQSLDQIAIPDFEDQVNTIADWILDDPAHAAETLIHYRCRFSPDGEKDVDASDEELVSETQSDSPRLRYRI